ncbi:MAG: PEP-CTERM sorting domain-containing protein [Candidatus Omnitrophica bacterium]|nr:PEP-CTERM sorting domain-containing protein [Candidatus Omnitrophota bacterium]
MRKNIIAVIMLGILLATCNAYAIVVNGYLDDWGVAPGAYGSSQWTPSNGATYTVEDQQGGIGTRLDPGYGGQLFDTEAMYYKKEGGTIYLAIVTGHPSAGVLSGGIQYYPGDVYLNFGNAVYGIQVLDPVTKQLSGKIYKNAAWNVSPYWGNITTIQDGTGTSQYQLTSDEFVYDHTYYGSGDYNDHYVMEFGIPDYYFGDDWENGGTIYWTETCGNDYIQMNIAHTPEPATLSLLGLGLAGLFGFRRKRRLYR